MMTKSDEDIFLFDKNEHEKGIISQEKTSLLTSTTNKKFPNLSRTPNMVGSGINFF